MAQSTTRLLWRGRESVETIRRALRKGGCRIELDIPNDYHHTLFSRLCEPPENTMRFEQVDLRAGPELLSELATIRGLEELGDLVEPVRAADVSLHLLSPSPTLYFELPGTQSPPTRC